MFLFAADILDLTLIILFVVGALGLPLVGYWLMYLDIRAYYRALKGVLVVVKNHIQDYTPDWAIRRSPDFLSKLGLDETCTENDIKQAYRGLAKKLHPDRGGDPQLFHDLQKHVDKAIRFVQQRNKP